MHSSSHLFAPPLASSHICSQAIAYAELRGLEPAVIKALKDGPPGSVRPWASLVAKNFRNDFFAHMCTQTTPNPHTPAPYATPSAPLCSRVHAFHASDLLPSTPTTGH